MPSDDAENGESAGDSCGRRRGAVPQRCARRFGAPARTPAASGGDEDDRLPHAREAERLWPVSADRSLRLRPGSAWWDRHAGQGRAAQADALVRRAGRVRPALVQRGDAAPDRRPPGAGRPARGRAARAGRDGSRERPRGARPASSSCVARPATGPSTETRRSMCRGCGRSYNVEDGIPRMLDETVPGVAEKAREAEGWAAMARAQGWYEPDDASTRRCRTLPRSAAGTTSTGGRTSTRSRCCSAQSSRRGCGCSRSVRRSAGARVT